MAEQKTKPTRASVDAYLKAKASADQMTDAKAIMAICKRVTKKSPQMWGPSIVGYGAYHYTYESGRTGTAPILGFAVRGKEFVVYISNDSVEQKARLAKLGKHKLGKVCLYFKRVADVDVKVLEALMAGSVAEMRKKYPDGD